MANSSVLRRLLDNLENLVTDSSEAANAVRAKILHHAFLLRERLFRSHYDRWTGNGWFKDQPNLVGICNVMADELATAIWNDSSLRSLLQDKKLAVFVAESDYHVWLIVQHGSKQQWILDASRSCGVLFDSFDFVAAFTGGSDLRWMYLEQLAYLTPIEEYLRLT